MNLVDLLAAHNVTLRRHGEHHHSGRGWVSVDCLKCSPGWGRFRLGFEASTGRCRCWMCGRMDGVEVLSKLCGITLREAAVVLRQRNVEEYAERKTGKLKLPPHGELGDAHKSYLRGRGFDPADIEETWGVKGIGFDGGNLKWRLLIPVHDNRGRVVSWTTRAIGSGPSQRYVSAPVDAEDVPHKELLYGSHMCRNSVLVCEGPLDAWAIGPGAVATFGVSYTQAQVDVMLRYPVRVVCYDSDAQPQAEKLCRQLSAYPGSVVNLELETGKDPADCDPAEILEIRQKFL